jgi:hypothetical protein
MNARYALTLILGCSLFGAATGALSQNQSSHESNQQAMVRKSLHPIPTNLKVLPKEMSGDDIDKLMHRYKQELGVPCGYCHEENPQTRQIDYASDENPVKETARFMIRMNNDINSKYLAQLGDRRYAEPFTCGNCHQGQIDPPAFEPRTAPHGSQ